MFYYSRIYSSYFNRFTTSLNIFNAKSTSFRLNHTLRPLNVNACVGLGLPEVDGVHLKYKIQRQNRLKKSYRSFSSESVNEYYIPRRSVLYVPGNDKRKISKISGVKSDCIVLDCEDGVAQTKKAEARETILEVLQKKNEIFVNKDCSVRVNGVETEHFELDLEKVLTGPLLPATILLPKVESEDDIKFFSDKLKNIFSSKNIKEKLRLIVYVESAKSLLNLKSICEYTIKESEDSYFILDGICFGSDDFCADIGATRTSEAKETIFARQFVVTVAKSFSLQAIDVVYIDYKDLEGLKRQSEEGNQFGFTGKQVIHPSQVDIVQTAFSPSPEKIRWAEELIRSFKKHQEEGKGAFNFEGNMIDRPLLLQAQNVLKIANVSKT